jgi:hypothetical protein
MNVSSFRHRKEEDKMRSDNDDATQSAKVEEKDKEKDIRTDISDKLKDPVSSGACDFDFDDIVSIQKYFPL